MVKRFDSTYYEGHESTDGEYVLHSEYAALQDSHDRLLSALIRLDRQAGDNRPLAGALRESNDAIAAAQPFTET